MKCSVCGEEIPADARFCAKCGAESDVDMGDFITVTTPDIPGYKITKVFGVVTGLTPRTTGIFGKVVAGLESMLGGEVTAFTGELEKARMQAIKRVQYKAQDLGANAIVGLDLETSDVGMQLGVVVISATGTAVVVEKE
ncbi:MAG: heavy metal-binding domain-containing protein [Candidatus Bathyarchaeota archaeon]|nr:heavy metal-binding domain-containing protein [Candidatus Bathyarchaeota archaeon]